MSRMVVNGDGMVDGLQSFSYERICQLVLSHIFNCIKKYDMDCMPIALAIHGSRGRHASCPTSDLDIVFEYSGTEREDDCFNCINENPLFIEGIEVDINPIRQCETGNLDRYLGRSHQYDSATMCNTTTYSLGHV